MKQTFIFKVKSRKLLEARNLILTEIINDSTTQIHRSVHKSDQNDEQQQNLIKLGSSHLCSAIKEIDLFVDKKAVQSKIGTNFSGTISSYVYELAELIEFFDVLENINEKYSFIIDCLKLYLIITPSTQKNSVEHNFRNAILLYNNSCYLMEVSWKYGLKNYCKNGQPESKKEIQKLYNRIKFLAQDILQINFKEIYLNPFRILSEKFPKLESHAAVEHGEDLLQSVLDILETKLACHGNLMTKETFTSVLLKPYLDKALKIIVNILVSYEDIITEESKFWIFLLNNLHSQIFDICKEFHYNSSELLADIDVLNQLVFLLDCTLVDLDEAYYNGKGPLARHFNKFQLRRLIRALWSTSDKRARMLEKLRD